jgi:hypothetical protein
MIYFIISIFSIVVLCLYSLFGKQFEIDEEIMCGWLVSKFLMSFIIGFIFLLNGITDYASLEKDKIEVQTLVEGIKDIKNSYYKLTYNSKNSIINGSIENIKQSTNLSKYISKTIRKKSKYNAYLKKCQIYESTLIYNIFADGFFIDRRIQDIKLIK